MGNLLVERLYFGGESSGNCFDEFLELLSQGSGLLEATATFEQCLIKYLQEELEKAFKNDGLNSFEIKLIKIIGNNEE